MATLKIYRGATYNEPLDLGAVDLTGGTVYFTAKTAFDADTADSAAAIAKDITVHDDAVNGISRLTLTSADTDITPATYIFDLHVKLADGTVIAYKPETLKILPSVTLRS